MKLVKKVPQFLLGLSLLAFATWVHLPAVCWADDIYTIVVKKQEEKAKNRWSLSDWLETRDRMRLQDLWLALHSPSPYEFYLSGNYQINQATPGGSFNAWEAAFAAYASIFGLEGRYEAGLQNRWWGIFNLRVFGFHDQGTNLTLQVGIRNTGSGTSSYRNALAGVNLTLYFARPFGVEGQYRHYFPSTTSDTGVSYSGERYQGGAFLEFKMIRFYGDYFYSSETQSTTTGILAGAKVYF